MGWALGASLDVCVCVIVVRVVNSLTVAGDSTRFCEEGSGRKTERECSPLAPHA